MAIDLDMIYNSEINKAALHLQAAYIYTFLYRFCTIFKHFDANYTANVEHMIDN